MVHIMNYRLIIYTICIFISAFGVSGININQFIRQNRVWEARVLCIVLSIVLGYALGNFVIEFLNL